MQCMNSYHSKEGFLWGLYKEKGAWSFWGKELQSVDVYHNYSYVVCVRHHCIRARGLKLEYI